MYIYDCLYGKIEFDDIIYKCMLTPEMQRLREVRLGNINSLFLTGSANCNRFEHSVGTAFLAKINYESNIEKPKKKEKNNFVLAALFHDLANGPFGHSYEYLQEKKGFVPEENVGSVIKCSKEGIYKKGASLEPIFFGQYNQIISLLKEDDINEIDEIILGNNLRFSKLISDVIDLDNIDNVFRMAYHMGIEFDKNAPVKLARTMLCKEGTIYFQEEAYPYLYEWHKTRKRLYKMLLFNPQDFAAKCMLTELIDVVLEYDPKRIQWYYTDYDLLMALKDIGEIWVQESVEVKSEEKLEFNTIIANIDRIGTIVEAILGVNISKNLSYEIDEYNKKIRFTFNNTHYVIKNGKIYKMKRNSLNVTNIVSRLMTGDLYYCLSIFLTEENGILWLFCPKKREKKIRGRV